VLGKKLGGITVHAGARVSAQAGPSEVLVSSMLKDLLPASGFTFADRGTHELKGIEGQWHLYAVTGIDGTPRPGRPDPQEAARLREEIKPPPLTKRRSGRIGIVAIALLVVVGAVLFLTNRPHPIHVQNNSLVRIDPATNQIVADVPVTEPDGAQITYVPLTHEIWVLSQRSQVISVVNTRTYQVHPVPVAGGRATSGADGFGIVYAFGHVWVTGGNGLEELNPITRTAIHTKPLAGAPAVLAQGFDRLWVTLTSLGRVDAIDPKSFKVVKKSDTSAEGTGIVAGEGAVWVARIQSGAVAEVDPTSGRVRQVAVGFNVTIGNETVHQDGTPSRLAIGDNSVWASDNVNGVVYRIDPTTYLLRVIHVGKPDIRFAGSGIAWFDGSIWVTSPGSQDVVRIDPAHDAVEGRIHLPYPPNGLVVADGSVWVTVNTQSQ
jgi:Streptogramin lyase